MMDDYEEIMNIMDEAGSLAEKTKIHRELYSNKDTGDFTPHNVGALTNRLCIYARSKKYVSRRWGSKIS